MYYPEHCSVCGQLESKHGYGCENPECPKYYKKKEEKPDQQDRVDK